MEAQELLTLPDVGFFWNLERGGGAIMAPLHKIHKNDDFLPKTHHNIKHIQSFREKSKKSGWRHHDVTMTS